MKEITYQELFFLIIVNQLEKKKSISKIELEEMINKIKLEYYITSDFYCSNNLEEILEDHDDLISIDNNEIIFSKTDYIKALERYKKDCFNDNIHRDIDDYLENEYKINKNNKIKRIHEKYLRNTNESIRKDIENICNEKYKVLTKNSEARK